MKLKNSVIVALVSCVFGMGLIQFFAGNTVCTIFIGLAIAFGIGLAIVGAKFQTVRDELRNSKAAVAGHAGALALAEQNHATFCQQADQFHKTQLEQAEARRVTELSKFAGITDLEAELLKKKGELIAAELRLKNFEHTDTERREKLEQEYTDALAKYEELKHEMSLYELNLEDISFGVYEPHFTFQASAEYKTALENIRTQAKALVRLNQATTVPVQWSVGGSRREGERLTKLITKSLLRSFNGECEAVLASVEWNNAAKMEERVRKAYKQVNDLGDSLKISITPEYLELKLNEVRLAFEYEQKKYQEREELRAQREKMRDEQKAVEEIEEAQEEAESAEELYQRLLEQARKEAQLATGAQLATLTAQVATFEAKLDEARKKKDKAISRAQLTKSGFVYVISNIGAFGEHVFKIGMTRRLEPMDRIAELSGASVPFPFDLHAMMFSLNAPELETALHKHFDERKVNLVNPRKEFYHHVDLSEIEAVIQSKGITAQFIEYPEARQYRETLLRRKQREAKPADETKFEETLFTN
jgi:hypothetical protein